MARQKCTERGCLHRVDDRLSIFFLGALLWGKPAKKKNNYPVKLSIYNSSCRLPINKPTQPDINNKPPSGVIGPSQFGPPKARP